MKYPPRFELLVIVILVALVANARADFIFSPRNQEPIDGNSAPFFVTSLFAPSFRYQELRNANEFSSFGSPVLITEFSLWRHPGSLPIDFTLPNVEINFSTTQRLPISATFANNTGADETTVFSGPLHLVDTGGQYGIHIPLQTPFLYDPSQGNFLMDFKVYETVPSPGPISIPYAVYFSRTVLATTVSIAHAPDANATSATAAVNGAVFTRFTVTPVPEPSTWVLLATGFPVLAFARRKWNRTR